MPLKPKAETQPQGSVLLKAYGEKKVIKNENEQKDFYLFAPKMQKFFKTKRKSEALVWIPVETSLLFSDEYQKISPISRGIFTSFLLLCGIRGDFEIPFRINYLVNVLGVNRKTLHKGIEELIAVNLLHKRERKKEEKEKNSTDSTEREDVAVCVNENDFGIENENNQKSKIENQKSKTSQFTIEECLKYAEICKSKGEDIKSPKALANHLFKTGESDAFILATLYPAKQEEIDREIYGEPRQFTDEPCTVCFGAKMAEVKGKGYQKCEHCRNEKGKATGLEPLNT